MTREKVLIEADHYVNKKILVVGGGDSAVEAAMVGFSSLSGRYSVAIRTRFSSGTKKPVSLIPRRWKICCWMNAGSDCPEASR